MTRSLLLLSLILSAPTTPAAEVAQETPIEGIELAEPTSTSNSDDRSFFTPKSADDILAVVILGSESVADLSD